ncbi:helix-turn-helix transcriptional regulator [Pigmentiphaga aceris]|uniref:Helix-turn-helix transcriptional regulator n=1 Tax=Pigmentiphaga aceris TaxID=1940612 RepID=A0A5C0ASK9_9BURK|nr:metalloregulator ArsR/SmtB family transcription factor [Pigmentiphaga aceris]QEI04626.1 helix-turn-helix transcriptional regulator [Pigmentiphaga aceris]
MTAELSDTRISHIAAAIAEPARTRMLCSLMDGHARTSTELAVVGEVSPSTASAHLSKLRELRLLRMYAQGKHRYYALADEHVAAALEALMVLAGMRMPVFAPTTPGRLQLARTCYDHMAGTLGVAIHDHFMRAGWLQADAPAGIHGDPDRTDYVVSAEGEASLTALGVDVNATRKLRRRFACACLDWSMRRPHLGGALGAAVLAAIEARQWISRDLDTRALQVTRLGEREFMTRWGIAVPDQVQRK